MAEVATSKIPEAGETQGAMSLVVSTNPQSPLWQSAELIEGAVFQEVKYVESANELQDEYRKYLPHTRMVAAVKNGETIGAMRVIDYDPEIGLKTLNDIQQGRLTSTEQGREILAQTDPTTMVEVGTIALEKNHRTSSEEDTHAISGLYASIYAICRNENKPNIVASFDEDYANRFQQLFGPAVIALGPATDYIGSPTVPIIMNVDRLKEYFTSVGAGAYVDSLLELGNTMINET